MSALPEHMQPLKSTKMDSRPKDQTSYLFKAIIMLVCLFANTIAFSQTIFYVSTAGNDANNGTSWNSAFRTLQTALATANVAGDQVWVVQGTYYPDEGTGTSSNFRTSSFVLKNNLAVYGGFTGTETLLSQRNWKTNVTTLSGDIDQNDAPNFLGANGNSYHVVLNDNNALNNTAVLDGFTITAGNANGLVSPHNYGGGVANFSSSPTINNCRFLANNGSSGGGMANSSSSPAIVNCSFAGNKGGIGGGMSNTNSSPAIVNCIFSGNKSSFSGSGMDNDNSSPAITNCSFSGNSNFNDGNALYNYNSSPSITNTILWGDDGTEIFKEGTGASVITYSLVQGMNPAGTGNLNGTLGANNPLFVLQPDYNLGPTTAGNLRLQAGSPCMNVGNNAANNTTLDLDANVRKVGVIDLGAYEVQLASGITHYFRSIASGTWNTTTTWESSPVADFSSGVVSPATLVPGANASGITVRNGHVVIVSQNATANKLTVNTGATLQVSTGIDFTTK